MTANEKKQLIEAIADLKAECNTLEELYLQTRSINLRWIKQSLEEKAINQLKELIK